MYFQNIYYKHNLFIEQKNIIILKINIQTGGLDYSDASRQAFHNQTTSIKYDKCLPVFRPNVGEVVAALRPSACG